MTSPKPVVLCILDGWGLSPSRVGNAPLLAETPNFDRIWAECPHATLVTHGRDVGLPAGQMGNSEVGHMNIGAGRVVAMDLGQIDLAIEDGSFAQNPALNAFIDGLRGSGGTAHIIGLVSDGGVHGHIDHIVESCRIAAEAGISVALHAITDGRDVAPSSADAFVEELIKRLPDGVNIATVIGRYYAMDRDNRWERVETAYRAMVQGEGRAVATAQEAVASAYAEDLSDEFFPAFVIGGYTGMKEHDAVFCTNFRADRARQILAALGDPTFHAFDVAGRPSLTMLGMVNYSDNHNGYMTTCFPKQEVINTLGAWVAAQGKRQFHLAETEKYPHVTFFLNGGTEAPYPGEDRHMAPSPKVATYDMQPEMAAGAVTDAFVAAIEAGYDLIVTNFANPDMVGHTGDLAAAISACEAVDRGLGAVLAALEKAGGAMIVTADHGNCETMIDPETGGPHTAHTTNPVPVIVVGWTKGAALRDDGRLADLSPTLLEMMGLPLPDEMTGKSLIV